MKKKPGSWLRKVLLVAPSSYHFEEFPFQPVLTARAKSVPKRFSVLISVVCDTNRRKPEEVHVPIYDRLIQAGVRLGTSVTFVIVVGEIQF
jgi:hypothetical protein